MGKSIEAEAAEQPVTRGRETEQRNAAPYPAEYPFSAAVGAD